VEIKEKKLVLKRLKEIRCSLSVAPVGPGPTKLLKKTIRFTTLQVVKPEFPGGMAKFYKYVGITIELLKKKV
jgi:protein TonB